MDPYPGSGPTEVRVSVYDNPYITDNYTLGDYGNTLLQNDMFYHGSIASIALAAVLCIAAAGARAHDPSKYPDWAGQWRVTGGNKWDPTPCSSRW